MDGVTPGTCRAGHYTTQTQPIAADRGGSGNQADKTASRESGRFYKHSKESVSASRRSDQTTGFSR